MILVRCIVCVVEPGRECRLIGELESVEHLSVFGDDAGRDFAGRRVLGRLQSSLIVLSPVENEAWDVVGCDRLAHVQNLAGTSQPGK